MTRPSAARRAPGKRGGKHGRPERVGSFPGALLESSGGIFEPQAGWPEPSGQASEAQTPVCDPASMPFAAEVTGYLVDCARARRLLDPEYHPTETGAVKLIWHRTADQARQIKAAFQALTGRTAPARSEGASSE